MKECLANAGCLANAECLAKACQIDWLQGIQQRSMLKSVAHPCLLALGYVSTSEGKKRLSLGFYRRLLLLAVLYKALLSSPAQCFCYSMQVFSLYSVAPQGGCVCAAGTIYTI